MINWEVGKAYKTRKEYKYVLSKITDRLVGSLYNLEGNLLYKNLSLYLTGNLYFNDRDSDLNIIGEWDEPKRAVLVGTEEGSECRRDGCEGKIGFHHECQCSVSRAPCWQCENAKLTCTMCEWEEPNADALDAFAYKSPPANKTYTMDEYAACQRALNEILGDLSAARDNKPDDRRPFKMVRNPNYKRDMAARCG